MRVNFAAQVLGQTGYDRHAQGLIKAIQAEGVEVGVESLAPLPQGWERTTPDYLKKCLLKTHPRDPTVMISLPHLWRVKLADQPSRFYGFFVWESPQIPQGFLENMRDSRITGVFVPSTFNQKSLAKYGISSEVVPHGVDVTLFKPRTEPRKEGDKFTFLFPKGWGTLDKTDRNGIASLIQAWNEEFKKDEPVRLLLKFNPSYNQQGTDYVQAFRHAFPESANAAEIVITNDLIDDTILPLVYQSADVTVLPTMGESFGLTMLESQACGVPVITTDTGGQTDFVNQDNGWIIHTTPVPAPKSAGYLYEGCNWAEADIPALRKAMREAYTNKTLLAEKAEKSRTTAEAFTWKASAQKICSILGIKGQPLNTTPP